MYGLPPIEQSSNSNLKNILVWTSFTEEKKAWVNRKGHFSHKAQSSYRLGFF
jgi:hypothetical protein